MAQETGKKKYTYYPGCNSRGSAALSAADLQPINMMPSKPATTAPSPASFQCVAWAR